MQRDVKSLQNRKEEKKKRRKEEKKKRRKQKTFVQSLESWTSGQMFFVKR